MLVEPAPAVHTLEAEIYVTHFVNKLVFEADGLVLDHRFHAVGDSNRHIQVDLRPLCRQQGKWAILTLRLGRWAFGTASLPSPGVTQLSARLRPVRNGHYQTARDRLAPLLPVSSPREATHESAHRQGR